MDRQEMLTALKQAQGFIGARAKMAGVGDGNMLLLSWFKALELAIHELSVDAVPVVHGRWIDENPDDSLDPRMRCSICTGVESPLIKWRYCPNCGAKMDEEV